MGISLIDDCDLCVIVRNRGSSVKQYDMVIEDSQAMAREIDESFDECLIDAKSRFELSTLFDRVDRE